MKVILKDGDKTLCEEGHVNEIIDPMKEHYGKPYMEQDFRSDLDQYESDEDFIEHMSRTLNSLMEVKDEDNI